MTFLQVSCVLTLRLEWHYYISHLLTKAYTLTLGNNAELSGHTPTHWWRPPCGASKWQQN